MAAGNDDVVQSAVEFHDSTQFRKRYCPGSGVRRKQGHAPAVLHGAAGSVGSALSQPRQLPVRPGAESVLWANPDGCSGGADGAARLPVASLPAIQWCPGQCGLLGQLQLPRAANAPGETLLTRAEHASVLY